MQNGRAACAIRRHAQTDIRPIRSTSCWENCDGRRNQAAPVDVTQNAVARVAEARIQQASGIG
jgi:hypothetical protein